MRKSRFTDSQIVAILKEGEAGVALSELTRKHGTSRATYFNWQAKYGGVSVSELKRMKGLHVAAPAQVSNWHSTAQANVAGMSVAGQSRRARVREAFGF